MVRGRGRECERKVEERGLRTKCGISTENKAEIQFVIPPQKY